MTARKRPQDEDIGRPGPWGADRYQQPGSKPDQSVLTPPGTLPDGDKVVSTPVTRKDYEAAEEHGESDPDPPGGDAG
jgi:hypothetical protein